MYLSTTQPRGYNARKAIRMDKVTFQTNVPIELRFQFLEGRLGESKFGGQQYMFSTDQGPFWVSEAVGNILHEQIRKQHIQIAEPIEICKREVSQGNGRKSIQWQLTKVGFAPGEQPDGTFVLPNPVPNPQPGAGVPPPAPAATAASQPPSTSNGNGNKPNGNPANGGNAQPYVERPRNSLEDALKTVVGAIVAANDYAKTVGYALPQFTSEDIRTMADTLVMQKGGR
jgi:hypothetical protein